MAPGLLKILIASMQQYSIMYITLYLFICMHFICIYYSFPEDSGVYVGVCPVHNHRLYIMFASLQLFNEEKYLKSVFGLLFSRTLTM